MSALGSLLVQLVAIGAGLYLGFTGDWLLGIGLGVASQVLHWLAEKLADGLMRLHGRFAMTLFERNLTALSLSAGDLSGAPAAWTHISVLCGWLYVGACSAAIWYCLSR